MATHKYTLVYSGFNLVVRLTFSACLYLQEDRPAILGKISQVPYLHRLDPVHDPFLDTDTLRK